MDLAGMFVRETPDSTTFGPHRGDSAEWNQLGSGDVFQSMKYGDGSVHLTYGVSQNTWDSMMSYGCSVNPFASFISSFSPIPMQRLKPQVLVNNCPGSLTVGIFPCLNLDVCRFIPHFSWWNHSFCSLNPHLSCWRHIIFPDEVPTGFQAEHTINCCSC